MEETTILYRPIGHEELELIEKSGFAAFPPRLPEQPIFYPVLQEQYATQIARDWNTRHGKSKRGYVTRFRVMKSFLDNYEVQTVGGVEHQEYWIPAAHLEEFNRHIVGKIEIVAEYEDKDVKLKEG